MSNIELISTSVWESASEAFQTMIFLPIEKLEDDSQKVDSETSLICSITFMGPFQGVLAINCALATAEKVARAMLMMEPDDELTESDTCDALGEVTNMVIGGLKSRILEELGEIQISIPSVVRGVEIRPAMGKQAQEIEVYTKVDGDVVKMSVICKG